MTRLSLPRFSCPQFSRLVFFALLLPLIGCEPTADDRLIGYVEADYIHVALPEGGRMAELLVKRGDVVDVDQPLFRLDAAAETAALSKAEAELKQAEAILSDMRLGERPEELAVIKAQLDAAQASLTLSEPRVKRRRTLVKNNIVGEEDLDAAEASVLSDRGRAAEMSARMAAAQLPQRPDAIRAQEAAVEAAKAALAQASWRLGQRSAVAPVAGRIEDVFYRAGEEVAAGRPVLQLLPPGNVKLRLYVPERLLAGIKIGDLLDVTCDACAANLRARISFIADAAEFTPPIIYSRDSRTKLVFLIEARPLESGLVWHPGQPIEAELPAGQE